MKILNTGDLHIHDYPSHNLESPNWRLEQFLKLAYRLAYLYKLHGCKKIVVSGDTLQTPRTTPEVQHVMEKFYLILQEAVKENDGEVVIQIGNHDKDTRSQEVRREDTVVTLMDNLTHVKYLNQVTTEWDGLRVGFQDFLPEQNLSWLEGRLDILFNHFTDVGPGWNGQEIDKTRFGVMFFADIHKPYHRGNIVSIGNPIPHRLGDSCEGKVLIIDTQGGSNGITNEKGMHALEMVHFMKVNEEREVSFYWADVITPETPFLRIYRPDQRPRRWAGELPYDVPVEYAKLRNRSTDKEFVSLENSLDVDAVINANLDDETRLIHGEVLEAAKNNLVHDEALNMNFKMIKTYIKNYRSVDELTINWRGGVLQISGDIGAGKSTVAKALMYCWYGDRNVELQFRDTADKKKDWLVVDCILEYEGTYYRVERGWERGSWLKYWKSKDMDKVVLDSYLPVEDPNCFQREQANKQDDIQAMIREDLPFLDLDKMMYVSQDSSGLFTDLKKNDRIEMVARLLGWSKVVDYSNISSNLWKLEDVKVSEVKSEITRIEGGIESISSMNLVKDETDYDQLITSAESNKAANRQVLDESEAYKKYMAETELLCSTVDALKSVKAPEVLGKVMARAEVEGEILSLKSQVESVRQDQKSEKDNLDSSRSVIRQKMAEVQSNIQKINSTESERLRLKGRMESVMKEIETAKYGLARCEEAASVEVKLSCPSCGQAVCDHEKVEEAKAKLQLEVDRAKSNLTECQDAMMQVATELARVATELSQMGTLDHWNSKNSELMDELSKIVASTHFAVKIESMLQSIYPLESYLTSLASYEQMQSTIQIKMLEINEREATLAQMPGPSQEEVEAATAAISNLQSQVMDYKHRKMEAARVNELIQKKLSMELEISQKKEGIADSEKRMVVISKYIDLTSFTGPIVQSILKLTSEMLSTEKMTVKTIEEKKNGNHKPDLTLAVKIGENWKEYDQLSGGQRFYADIQFMLSLAELTKGIGLMIFDEAFKFLHPNQIEEVGMMIQQNKSVKDDLIITHYDSYSQVDYRIHARLDDSGVSIYEHL